ncbi:MAG: HAD-IIIA family hydrolase [Crocinitomicaceae bacterium]|nr:HAD-IIIA family hydrolase [Crocinitomicaceae bacterium]MDG1776901.1 HAD-IIIA family hydrolase [Crocinitomicaceae bacterium]
MSISSWNIDETWTLFLDRDGVINERIFGAYVTRVSEFKFLKNAQEAIAALSNVFHLTFVVTNQQGIGKGLMTEGNLLEIHTYMCDEVYEKGGKINKCLFAPNLKGADCDMRKPGPAMAELAQLEYPEVQFDRCVMVGDTDSDILFGKNLGMKTVRIKTEEAIGVEADLTVSSLYEFSKKIKNEV